MHGYLRLFSILSLLAVIAIAVTVGMAFRNMTAERMTYLTGRANSGMAQGYVNAVWSKHRGVILPLAANPSQLRGNPQVVQFAQDTVEYFRQMPLVRVNLYSASGLLLMTANINPGNTLMGNQASPDSGFVNATVKGATPSSMLVHDVALQSSAHATLVQTVMPVRGATGAPEISIEMLSDVTAAWDGVTHAEIYSIGGIIALFLVFLGMLFIASRRAEIIIAKQHEANLELTAAAATAQAENREKSQFLANISHELRTPLNAIIGFSDVIRNEVMPQVTDKKYHDYINDIHSSGTHLLSLINDILDYSKAEAGKLELEVSEVNVSKMVQNCLRLVSPRAESGQVKLVEELPKEQFTMSTDSKKFKQVLLNLLSNAVKFTPPGGEVSVNAWQNVADDTFSFEVSDTGIGIAPKDISRAMAPFGQVDNTLKRKYEGTGLGLPLTKKFVELMGGKFNIESEVGKGTTVTFTLPRQITPREGLIIKQAS